MEKTRYEKEAEALAERAHNLPKQLKRALTRRAVQDAKNLLLLKEELTLEQLAFTIYRAYALGAALYNKDNENSSDEKKTS